MWLKYSLSTVGTHQIYLWKQKYGEDRDSDIIEFWTDRDRQNNYPMTIHILAEILPHD